MYRLSGIFASTFPYDKPLRDAIEDSVDDLDLTIRNIVQEGPNSRPDAQTNSNR
jgi:hypothetical protein